MNLAAFLSFSLQDSLFFLAIQLLILEDISGEKCHEMLFSVYTGLCHQAVQWVYKRVVTSKNRGGEIICEFGILKASNGGSILQKILSIYPIYVLFLSSKKKLLRSNYFSMSSAARAGEP